MGGGLTNLLAEPAGGTPASDSGGGSTSGGASGFSCEITIGGCWFCCWFWVCFHTRNNAAAAMPIIAIARIGHRMLRGATTTIGCAFGEGDCTATVPCNGRSWTALPVLSAANGGGVD